MVSEVDAKQFVCYFCAIALYELEILLLFMIFGSLLTSQWTPKLLLSQIQDDSFIEYFNEWRDETDEFHVKWFCNEMLSLHLKNSTHYNI